MANLKPWREVAVPHRDVLEGNFPESEFAADLSKVVAGTAPPEYQDPVRFFKRTFITEGIKSREFFGFAAGKDDERYWGLLFGQSGAVYLDDAGLLVEPATAARAKDRIGETPPPRPPGPGAAPVVPSGPGPSPKPGPPGPGPATAPPTRFYGTVELNPVSASMDFASIMNEVVQHFTAKYGSTVTLSVEVNASHPEGFDEHVQRTVKTNCGVRKFGSFEFEE